MVDLENPPENPCFGCGPRHPRGLRLSFRENRTADGTPEVQGNFTPKPDEIGWPTLFHHGLHFTVLYEASYWAALTLGGALWVSYGPITYHADRLPRVGVAHVVTARLVHRGEASLSVHATTATDAGKPCGSLESTWRPARRDVIERAGIPLPDYLSAEIPR
ncbi:MAG: hypothetical protein WB788_05375 [Thermoplasmata archaeon]